ncbi:response regulator [Pseudomonas chlororaphis]|uniref:response regulator n=1 Tax=Pseudomonas chlororaphis TaxID=587753 RepID=UPI001B307BF7|nr:response regulator [Pseudomonas chlororaphis]QTT81997.1 response regulator [Pseudomonas chlororaphis]
MDASFRVLWFEDNPKYVGEIQDAVQARMHSYGMKLDVKMINNFENGNIERICRELRQSCSYDLVMVDYDLGVRDLKGDELLKRLRRSTSISMIFYSAKNTRTLRELLLEKGVDGVFCLARDARLAGEVYSIVESALGRVVQTNYMRGIVVSSVSHMDRLFTDIIAHALDELRLKEPSDVLAGIKDGFLEYQKEEREQIERITEKTLVRYISKANFHVKTKLLLELLNIEGSSFSDSFLAKVERFIEEVGNKRNKFAHTPTEYVDGEPRIKIDSKVLGHKDMKEILCTIREHIEAAEQAIVYFRAVPPRQ